MGANCLIGKRYRTRERSVLEVGLSKDVLLMVGRAFRWLHGKEMRERKGLWAALDLANQFRAFVRSVDERSVDERSWPVILKRNTVRKLDSQSLPYDRNTTSRWTGD